MSDIERNSNGLFAMTDSVELNGEEHIVSVEIENGCYYVRLSKAPTFDEPKKEVIREKLDVSTNGGKPVVRDKTRLKIPKEVTPIVEELLSSIKEKKIAMDRVYKRLEDELKCLSYIGDVDDDLSIQYQIPCQLKQMGITFEQPANYAGVPFKKPSFTLHDLVWVENDGHYKATIIVEHTKYDVTFNAYNYAFQTIEVTLFDNGDSFAFHNLNFI